MNTRPRSAKLQTTIAADVHARLGALAAAGVFGASRSEVAAYILQSWFWENQSKLESFMAHELAAFSEAENGDGS